VTKWGIRALEVTLHSLGRKGEIEGDKTGGGNFQEEGRKRGSLKGEFFCILVIVPHGKRGGEVFWLG